MYVLENTATNFIRLFDDSMSEMDMDTSCLSYEQVRSIGKVRSKRDSSIRWQPPTQTIISTVHGAQEGLDTVHNLGVVYLLEALIRI